DGLEPEMLRVPPGSCAPIWHADVHVVEATHPEWPWFRVHALKLDRSRRVKDVSPPTETRTVQVSEGGGVRMKSTVRRCWPAILFAVAVAGWGLVPSHAGAQMTGNNTPLPGLMGAMVVDPATAHVFVSLYDASEVVVLDFDGNIVTQITGLAGARGLAVVGNHVYVAAANAGAIDEIDTGTLTVTRTVASGLVSMDDLVAAGGALWAMSSGNLTRVAIANGAKTSYGNVAGTGLVGDPADPNTLFEFDVGSSPFGLARLDISSLPPTV